MSYLSPELLAWASKLRAKLLNEVSMHCSQASWNHKADECERQWKEHIK